MTGLCDTDAVNGGSESDAAPRRALPSGLVTFLMTDIEGSTRLLRATGDDYAELLDRHRRLLRSVWDEHRGHEVDATGDSFLVAFESSADALAAATAAAATIDVADWGASRLRVRIGLHCGPAYPRDGRYAALPVHQTARIGDAGHGGQVVATQMVVDRAATEGRRSADDSALGHFRVRDFDEPVEIVQVSAGDFAPLRLTPDEPHNLPLPLAPLLGRDELIERLRGELTASRLVSLVGPGGAGKTSLAKTVASQIIDRHRDGVWFVDLLPHDLATSGRAAVADVLGRSVQDLSGFLADADLVLVLDNLEHATGQFADLIDELLGDGPGVRILATSREPLDDRREVVVRVGPLAPDGGAARSLFLERVRSGGDDVDPDDPAIAEICRRLDGLPLALELAAGRVASFGLDGVLAALDAPARALRSRRRDLDERQRSLHELVMWSYRLLNDDSQRAARRLSVYPGGFTTEMAGAVVPEMDTFDVLDIVDDLVSKSIVVRSSEGGSSRFRMLETVRAVMSDALDASDEAGETLGTAARHLAAALDPTDPVKRAKHGLRADEIPNLRSLASAAADHDLGAAQMLAWALALHRTFEPAAGVAELAELLPTLARSGENVVGLLGQAAFLHVAVGDHAGADDLLALADSFGEQRGRGLLEATRCYLLLVTNRSDEVRSRVESVLDDAEPAERRALLSRLGHAAADTAERIGFLAEARSLGLALGMDDVVAADCISLSEAHHRAGQLTEASRFLVEGLRSALEQGQTSMLALGLVGGGRLAEDRGRLELAATANAAGERGLRETGLRMTPNDIEISERLVERLRGELGDDYDRLVAEGEAIDAVELIEQLTELLGD